MPDFKPDIKATLLACDVSSEQPDSALGLVDQNTSEKNLSILSEVTLLLIPDQETKITVLSIMAKTV